jgi:Tol biopolymer transport system component
LEPLGPRFRQVDLYAIDLVTRKEQRLTQYANTNMNPAWSPDGKLLAFASNRTGRYGIYILETATGEVHPFVSGKQWHARHPAWSPDGQTLVFEILETHEERIHIMMIQGTEQIMSWAEEAAHNLFPSRFRHANENHKGTGDESVGKANPRIPGPAEPSSDADHFGAG